MAKSAKRRLRKVRYTAKRRLRGVVVRQGFGHTYGLPKRHNAVGRTSNELIWLKGYNSLN